MDLENVSMGHALQKKVILDGCSTVVLECGGHMRHEVRLYTIEDLAVLQTKHKFDLT